MSVLSQSTEYDSIRNWLAENPSNQKVWVDNALVLAQKESNQQIDTALHYLKLGLIAATEIDYDSGYYNLLQYRGIMMRKAGDYQQAKLDLYKTLNYCKEQGDSVRIVSLSLSVGNLLRGVGQPDSALQVLISSLAVADGLHLERGQALIEMAIGNVYHGQEDFARSIDYFVSAKNTFKKLKSARAWLAATNNLGTAFYEMKMYDSALVYHQQVLALKTRAFKESVAVTYLSLGNDYAGLKQPYKAIEQYEAALKTIQKNNVEIQMQTLNKLGSMYMKVGRPVQAGEQFRLSRELAEASQNIKALKNSWEYQYLLDSTAGDYRSALLSYQKYNFYKDSLEQVAIQKNMDELTVRFETAQKDEEIAMLAKDNEVKELKLAQRNTVIALS
ncbi:MAG: tetratricopeptide repeat protein, partial [Bacteroidota bacterium]